MDEKTFTVITYNIDYQSPFQEERLYQFIEQVKEWNPDILAIQEGTKAIYSKLFLAMQNMGYLKKVDERYIKKDISEVIFTKFPIKKSEYIPFQHTKQKRNLTLYLLDVLGQDIWFGTTQLESGGKRTPFLNKQIKQIEKKVSKLNEAVILTGDFQLAEYQKNICEPHEMIDAWYDAGNSEQKYTIDSKLNMNVRFSDRPDRIWYKSPRDSKEEIECVEYSLVGLPNSNEAPLLASNHFGIYTKFEKI
jgi:endonuclease/exonuclease/phosphatase family metal-dependent hydrolase